MKHTIINKIISNRNKNTLNIEDSELKNMLKVLHKALDDKQAVDIKIIYVSKISSITDYFVITDANNNNHLSALFESVVEEMAKIYHTPLYRDADKDSGWLLLDYGPIIVHILTKANREFYNLESIWGEGLEISTEDF